MKSRNVFISVFDKSRLEVLASLFKANKDFVISTGGTAKKLRDLGVSVTDVSEVTGFPEVMDGRVKTLHPKIHMGLLARAGHQGDEKVLQQFGAHKIDVVIGNLYDFQWGVSKNLSFLEQIELIDVGGPSFLRAAAKSFNRITVLCDPLDYELFNRSLSEVQLRKLAAKVFHHTAIYDAYIARWLDQGLLDDEISENQRISSEASEEQDFISLEKEKVLTLKKVMNLRYGENPQQQASWYKTHNHGLHEAEVIQGKALSYNNLLDLDAGLTALAEFNKPCVVSVKHTNPCGVGEAQDLYMAMKASLEADPMSVFGGIVSCNGEVGEKEAAYLTERFLECVVAPRYTELALKIFSRKKNLRVLKYEGSDLSFSVSKKRNREGHLRSVLGGVLLQSTDSIGLQSGESCQGAGVVSWQFEGSTPDSQTLESLIFAWKVCAHLKSNAIAIVSGTRTVGLGMGQVSRIDAVNQAFQRQQQFHPEASNLVLASEAFFPFSDSIEVAHSYGVKWVIQPGGSIKDQEVISKARDLGVNIILTGQRHFKH